MVPNVPTPDDPGPLVCRRCGAGLTPGSGDFYQVTIEAVADPYPPVISGEESPADVRRRIEELLVRLAGVSEEEAMNQVYRRLTLYLCLPCYRRWIDDPTGGAPAG